MSPKLRNKIATSNHILSAFPIHEAISILADAGYDAIEIWSGELKHEIGQGLTSIGKVKEALDRTGIAGVIHCPLRNLASPDQYKYNICSKDPALRKESLEADMLALEHAHQLGFEVITIHPGHTDSPDKVTDQEYWDLQVDAFRQLAKKAEELKVKIGMEPMEHRPKEFVMEPRHVDRILKEVQSPNLGVTFDLIHAYTHGTDKPVEFLDGLHPHIFHVHMSGHSEKKNHVPFAHTMIHHFYLDKVLDKIVSYGYSGMISVEGTLKGIMEETAENQKNVVKGNLEYIHRELKSLHLI
jgi:sugar phosphate isomerase/epimerase